MSNDIKLTKYEITQIVGARARSLSMGAKPLIVLTETELRELNFNPVRIAMKEFEADVIPITVQRPMPKKNEN